MATQSLEDEQNSPESLPNSQFSQYSLELSQGTLAQILEVGGGVSNSNIVEEYFLAEEEEEATEKKDNEPANMEGPSSITIQRSLFTPTTCSSISPACSQQQYIPTSHFGHPPPIPSLYPPPLHHVVMSESGQVTSTNTTPTQSTPPSGSPGMSDCSNSSFTPSSHHHGHMSMLPVQSTQPFIPTLRPTIPSNMPIKGEYNFNLVIKDGDKPVSKTATFTYSNLTNRAYIRRDTTIGLTFSFSHIPPHALIRAMAIHKTPELVGEVLQCCPKHVDEQRKKGHQHPRHFICGASKSEAIYCEDPISGRLSVTIPINSLQQKSENAIQAFFVFPCFTSELHKGPGQLAQLIFTLEIAGHVKGRAVIDARVCASPGRDRENDEIKMTSTTNSSTLSTTTIASSEAGFSEQVRRSRKRPSSTITQNVECSLPSKVVCQGLSDKKQLYTAETYPELFPFIDVCIKMMERVYKVQVQVAEPLAAMTAATAAMSSLTEHMESDASIQEAPSEFTTVESWLQCLELTHYACVFQDHGIHQISQVIDLTDDQLVKFGISNKNDRKKILEGMKLILVAEPKQEVDYDDEEGTFSSQSTGLIPPLLSQTSTSSNTSATGSGSTMEILRIQMRKTFSNTSSSSSDSYNGY